MSMSSVGRWYSEETDSSSVVKDKVYVRVTDPCGSIRDLEVDDNEITVELPQDSYRRSTPRREVFYNTVRGKNFC